MLARPRLFRLLDRSRGAPLLWIAAPPGAGKTTLVSHYLEQRSRKHVWYQVDAGDRDVAGLLSYLALAVEAPGRRKSTPRLPRYGAEYFASLEDLYRSFFRGLFARLGEPATLVFDDYHELAENAEFHRAVCAALEQMPEGHQVVVLSRHPAPAAFARVRAEQRMTSLDADALKLTQDETRRLARVLRDKAAASSGSQRLHAQCEGWVTGFMLLLDRSSDSGADAAARDGRIPATIADYFDRQVFAKAAPELQRLWLRTAYLPRFTGATAARVAGMANAPALLATLAERKLFIQQHGAGGAAYGYHALWREFLRLTVEGTHTSDECARLMRRSADALREEGDHEAALALFATTSDWELAADIVRSGAPALLAQGRMQTLHEWIARLPRSHVDASARLLYWEAVCAAQLDPANSAPSIERAYGAFVAAADEAGQALCASLAITANFAEWGNFADRRRWLRILTELLERAPRFSDEIAELRAWAALLFVFSFEVGEFPLGEICADRVAALCRAPLPAGERLAAASQLLFHRNQVASSDAAKEVLNELRPLAESPEASPLQKAGWIWGEATYLFHAGAMTAARRRQAEALQLLAESGLQPMRTVLRLLDIWIVLAESNAALAAEMLDELAPQIDREKPNDVALYQHLRAWLALLEGRPHTAVEHAEQATRITRVHASRSSLVCSFSLAALAFAQCGRMREALEAAAEAVRGSTGAHGVVAFTALLFKCEVLRRCDGAQGELLATLGEAFGTARRSGFVHCLIWIPPLMSRLCAAALAAGIETEHVERLIRVRGLPPPAPDTEIWPWRLRIFTLGRFDVVIDGKRLGFSGKAQRRPLDLLKLLIALGGRKVAVDRLTAMLWPNAEGDAAHRAFKVSLHRLRRLLGVEVLHVESGEVTLDPQCTSVDVWTFERWFGEASARGRAAGETGATATDTVDRVLSLYHGPFLAGDARDWALGARERLRSKYVRGVMLAGDALESRGDDSHAGILYERGIDAEPAAEEIYARLMRCYRRLGRPADALAVYRRCEAMLAALVGTKPSRAVRSLYEEMRESL